MLQSVGDSDDAIIIEEESLDPLQKRKSIQLAYVIVGKVYRIELILRKTI